jgi:beta-aspartyl-peptidase (threonine type)
MSGKTVLTAVLAALGGLLVGAYWASRDEQPRAPNRATGAAGPRALLVIHGGAGVLDEAEMKDAGTKTADYEEGLAAALRAGYEAMRAGTSVDGVEKAIRSMEDSPLFNAGKGAALNREGKARLDASIMEGKMAAPQGDRLLGKRDPRKRAGAVADVRHVKNPISAARAVMEMEGQRHVLFAGEDAERFVLSDEVRKRYDLEKKPEDYFVTPWRVKQQKDAFEAEKKKVGRKQGVPPGAGGSSTRAGTVGAVACKGGTLAAGTSTGGLTDKLPGRVGDTPLIGSGTYADDRACGVSCTGTGEMFIRHALAYDVAARMLYSSPRLSVAEAARQAIDALPEEEGGVGSLIAMDAEGHFTFALSRELPGTYRGYVTHDGETYVGVGRGELKYVGKVGK